ncbi:hypothetical protein CBER1_10935 [Cercospora berteroae]|uniref:Uncharacterized protein n=1 Tax=Cercospora berteroae TaxID=357750 RepID=A0A2S6C9P8_9PEZI|nr:hypothetical protein CBER1_10935 [Cercospora berteroae]
MYELELQLQTARAETAQAQHALGHSRREMSRLERQLAEHDQAEPIAVNANPAPPPTSVPASRSALLQLARRLLVDLHTAIADRDKWRRRDAFKIARMKLWRERHGIECALRDDVLLDTNEAVAMMVPSRRRASV